jgi:hypothetical protein
VEAIATQHLGREVTARAAPGWLLKTLGLVSRDLRAFRPILDDYLQPIGYDARRLEDLLGPVHRTPYTEAIPATLDWLRTSHAR